jgi:uncharacterized protein
MAEVFFSTQIGKIIEQLDCSLLGKNVAIKVHFGERGCTTYTDPKIVKNVYDKIMDSGRNASLVDCNVLYRGARINKAGHIRTAKDHGFDFAPIDILDGNIGSDTLEIKTKEIVAKIGKGIQKYDSMVVITHFKGHTFAGYGGAIKNVGMGLGSRAGKLHMHSDIRPSIDNDKCSGCATCKENCGSDAIKIKDGHAKIIEEKCSGCATCIAVCQNGAVNIPWSGSTNNELLTKMAQYAQAVMQQIPNMIFVTALENITPECDCVGMDQSNDIMVKKIGYLMSQDIVAIDAASVDLVNLHTKNKFESINKVDKHFQTAYAEKIGMGKRKYDLKEI